MVVDSDGRLTHENTTFSFWNLFMQRSSTSPIPVELNLIRESAFHCNICKAQFSALKWDARVVLLSNDINRTTFVDAWS